MPIQAWPMAAGAAGSHTGGMEAKAAWRSVFIVEDSPAVRERLVALMEETAGICVVGEADTPKDAVEGILRTRPDWVLLDIQLVGGTGIDVLRQVRARVPDTTFVVLTNLANPHYRKSCIEAGASHFFDKTETIAVRKIIAVPQQSAKQ
jgi:DNA-binding NarL/FixJ family response regulator